MTHTRTHHPLAPHSHITLSPLTLPHYPLTMHTHHTLTHTALGSDKARPYAVVVVGPGMGRLPAFCLAAGAMAAVAMNEMGVGVSTCYHAYALHLAIYV